MDRLISEKKVLEAVSKGCCEFRGIYSFCEELIKAIPSAEPKKCKDCKWWKDSDGSFRRGCMAESKCPINTKTVYEGNGYCYMFEPQESEDKE